MKKTIVYFVAGLGLLVFGAFTLASSEGEASPAPGSTSSEVLWKGSKVTGSFHTGTIDLKESKLKLDGKSLKGGYFVADMSSISSTDLEGDMKARLEGHLKSDDFFGVETYPTARFDITEVKAASGKDSYTVSGKMKIKETTKEITFPVKMSWEDGKAVAKAELNVDRADFDVRFGSGRFFDNLGDNMIRDEFELTVTIESK